MIISEDGHKRLRIAERIAKLMEKPQSWYVYTYSKPDDTVFYVGKGTGNRINHHEREAASDCVCRKCTTIREIWASGEPVKKRIVFETLNEVEALVREFALIQAHSGKHLTNERILPQEGKQERKKIMAQKQWILSDLDLSHLSMAVATEIATHKQGRIVAHHLQNLEELAAKLLAIRESTGRAYYDEKDMDGTPCEQLLVTLIEQEVDEPWDNPYTVIPVGEEWAVVDRNTLRPVGEKTYSQRTHAYRANRRLNATARERKAPVSEQQLSSIRKLCEELGKPEPENLESLKYAEAKDLIQQLTVEYTGKRTQETEVN